MRLVFDSEVDELPVHSPVLVPSLHWFLIPRTDISTVVPSLEIPVYFFHGRYDYTCSYDLARKHFRKL
jgi:pimeloyl-ACP methyl ester carboxylesterase